ncbi:hypothetical protein G7Y79_00004g015090 [Physcia stellaris]|nr:hypothetical protein G7Y79_00004g015090 [Physcia stellaris]
MYDSMDTQEKGNSDADALSFLATNGYLPLLLADHDGMVQAYSNLFDSSTQFFSLPENSPQKTAFHAASGSAASEEGYSDLPGEKSIMTIKTRNRCPDILQQHAEVAWNLTGAFLQDIARKIASSLGLESEGATHADFVEDVQVFEAEGGEPKVNAERHKDLGLLSLVIGHSPGLEVLDPVTGLWEAIESEDFVPKEAQVRSGGLTATLLSGETMALLTRGRYKAGVHRVLCAPDRDNPYRFSIVFTLRPGLAPVYTMHFESDIVGRFAPEEQMDGQSSAELFERIRRSHWNVNVVKDLREEQQKRLLALAKAAKTSGSGGVAEEFVPPPGPPPVRTQSHVMGMG